MNTQTQQGQATPVRSHQPSQPSPRTRVVSATVGRASALLLLVSAFTLLGAGSAFAITRDAVLARAQTWVDSPVPYSQSRYFGGYRTDCSGYASMCWQTGTSYATITFYRVTRTITVDQLRPGDAMLKAVDPSGKYYSTGRHIRIFYGWVDAAHTRYVAYEQTGPTTKSSIKSLAGDLASGYKPTRYVGIADSPASNSVLKNGTFNVWASGDPVWWEMSGGDWSESVVVRRQDTYRSYRNALELVNTDEDPAATTALSQIASVTPDTTYTLSAWARTASDPAALEMGLTYLDASGATLAETRTTGDTWGLDATAFRRMTRTVVSPPSAVAALVTMRLAGGSTNGTAGTAVVLDDIALEVPQATISIRTNTTAVYPARTAVLSGSVTPTATIGRVIVVYVQKPGTSRWSYSSNRVAYELNGAPAWQYKYYFKPGMAKGYYTFWAYVPPLPGYLGSWSPSTVRVRLK